MEEKQPKLDEIFEAAVNIKAADERASYLDRACGADTELRDLVEQLLVSDDDATSFLNQPPTGFQALELHPPNLSQGDDKKEVAGDISFGSRSKLGITKIIEALPRVVLRSPDNEPQSIVQKLGSKEIPELQSNSKYQLHGEIARGGMGAIIQGRDKDLGRDLAIKVLLDVHKSRPETIQRFIEEAQIAGQLQHPGIVPIYELGQLDDERPFFSMKLIRGKTLAKVLADRGDENLKDLSKLIGIFEQVCQAMAYTHSRGVIHRDLKPSNIMIGVFGEVQVMDWGLAKVLQQGGIADENQDLNRQTHERVIQTLRSQKGPSSFNFGSSGSETQMGSVIGTLAYMPPEQALGKVDRLDERTDVFGLGAILCQIITGKPPYSSKDTKQIYELASCGNLTDCFERLDNSNVDAELVRITKACLEPEPFDRPRNAGVVAGRVSEYLESVESRHRAVSLQAAKKETQLLEERKRARLTLASTAVVAALVLVAVMGFWHFQNRESNRIQSATVEVQNLLEQAEDFANEAVNAEPDQQSIQWSRAIDATEQAQARADNSGLPESMVSRARENLARYRRQQERTQRESSLVNHLEAIRLNFPVNFNREAMHVSAKSYESAFEDAELDLISLSAEAAAKKIWKIEELDTLIYAINSWAYCLSGPSPLELFETAVWARDWRAAADTGKKLVEWKPNDRRAYRFVAVVLAASGDKEAYRRLCKRMLAKFENNPDPKNSKDLLLVCQLLPGIIDSQHLSLECLFRSVDLPAGFPGYTDPGLTGRDGFLAVLTELRQGNTRQAEASATRLLAQSPYSSLRQLALALRTIARVELDDRKGALQDLTIATTEFQATQIATPTERWGGGLVEQFEVGIFLAEARSKLTGVPTLAKSEVAYVPQKPSPDLAWQQDRERRLQAKLMAVLAEIDSVQQLSQSSNKPESVVGSTAMVAFEALKLRHAEENERVVRMLKVAQANNPDDFWLNFELASSLQVTDSPLASIPYMRSAVALRPDNVEAQFYLASMLCDTGSMEDAVRVLRRIISLAPNDLRVRRQLLLTWVALDDIPSARAEWNDAVAAEMNGNNFQSIEHRTRFIQYAVYLARIGEHEALRQECLRLLQNPPREPKWRDRYLANVALASLLVPDIVDPNLLDLESLEELVDDPAEDVLKMPGRRATLGLAAYRQADFERAARIAKEGYTTGVGEWSSNRLARVVHALASQELGETETARKLVDDVKRKLSVVDSALDRRSVQLRRNELFSILATKVLIEEFESNLKE